MSYSDNELINYEGVFRTAPATPSMLKIIESQKETKCYCTVCIKVVQSAKNCKGQTAFYPSSMISFVTFVSLLSSSILLSYILSRLKQKLPHKARHNGHKLSL